MYYLVRNIGLANAEMKTTPNNQLQEGWDNIWTQEEWDTYLQNNSGEFELPANNDFSLLTTFDEFEKALSKILDLRKINGSKSLFIKWRTAFKSYIISLGTPQTEEAGFNTLNAQQKKFAATYNIGTGIQRLLAIPNDQERDETCFNYIDLKEGTPLGSDGKPSENGKAAVWLKAICFSRADHLIIPGVGVTYPELVFKFMDITNPTAMEFAGSILELFKHQGLRGLAAGGKSLGIIDIIEETATTRYAPENGGGLKTNALLISGVQDGITNTTGISGFSGTALEQSEDFANYLKHIVYEGEPEY